MDFDGDVLSSATLLSENSQKEFKEYSQTPISLVDANGKLIYGLSSGKIVKYQIAATTYQKL